ncbi:hypothetical protein Tco_1479290 [Tanacetum coccineum]
MRIHHWEDDCKDFFKAEMGNMSIHKVYSNKKIITVTNVKVKRKWGYGFLMSIKVKRMDGKEYEFSYADFPRLRCEKLSMRSKPQKAHILHNRGIDHKIPYTTTRTDKGVVYLNNYNVKSLMLREEAHKFCDVKDIQRLKAMLETIEKTLKHREQMRRLEE